MALETCIAIIIFLYFKTKHLHHNSTLQFIGVCFEIVPAQNYSYQHYIGTCSIAYAKIKGQYDVLVNCPVNQLLPSLYAKDVITHDDKKIMESKPLEKDRMMYLLDDVLIRSLNMGFGENYNRFIMVLEESDNSLVNELAGILVRIQYIS